MVDFNPNATTYDKRFKEQGDDLQVAESASAFRPARFAL